MLSYVKFSSHGSETRKQMTSVHYTLNPTSVYNYITSKYSKCNWRRCRFTCTAVTYDSHMMVVDVISKQCSDQQALLSDATISSVL